MNKYLYLPCVALLALAACDDKADKTTAPDTQTGMEQTAPVADAPFAEVTTIPEHAAPVVAAPEHTTAPDAAIVDETGVVARDDTVGNAGPSAGMDAQDTPPAPNPKAFNEEAAAETTEPDLSCGDHSAWIGQPVDLEAIKATGNPHRIVTPGMPMTMDYRFDRINIEHDDANIVTRVWCG